ncbi:GTP cyclohydrolase II [Neptuniibacter halophilus]|uniref:GTP cyclohydrolase II n=1 Tax=Neptuniibacter halophilus TaxID=651666 RepID=UPI002572B0A3|nr:GTP cyclohydrolase II [Neptuniibacter halophilus]
MSDQNQQQQPELIRSVTVPMPTDYGDFAMTVFTEAETGKEHMLLVLGDVASETAPMVRIHSECATGDLFASERCDCGEQLQASLRMMSEQGSGVLLYLRQEGRGIGLANKLRAYQLQDQGLDTVDANLALGLPADGRDYRIAAIMLEELGISEIRLLTNNPAKLTGLQALGIRVRQRLPLQVRYRTRNLGYMKTKQQRMGHRVLL